VIKNDSGAMRNKQQNLRDKKTQLRADKSQDVIRLLVRESLLRTMKKERPVLLESSEFSDFLAQLKQQAIPKAEEGFAAGKEEGESFLQGNINLTSAPLARPRYEIVAHEANADDDFDPTKFAGDQLIALYFLAVTLRHAFYEIFWGPDSTVIGAFEQAFEFLEEEPVPYFGITKKENTDQAPDTAAEIQLAMSVATWESNIPKLFETPAELMGVVGGCLSFSPSPEFDRSLAAVRQKLLPLLQIKESPLENILALEKVVQAASELDVAGAAQSILGSSAIQKFLTTKYAQQESIAGTRYDSLPDQIDYEVEQLSSILEGAPEFISSIRQRLEDFEQQVKEYSQAKEQEPVEVDSAAEPKLEEGFLLLRPSLVEQLSAGSDLLFEANTKAFQEMVKKIKEKAKEDGLEAYQKAAAGEFEDQYEQEEEGGGVMGFVMGLFGKKEEFDPTKYIGDQISALWWITAELESALGTRLAFPLEMLTEYKVPRLLEAEFPDPAQLEEEEEEEEEEGEEDGFEEDRFDELYYDLAVELAKIVGNLKFELGNPVTEKYLETINKVLLPTLQARDDVLGHLESIVNFVVAIDSLNVVPETMKVLTDKKTQRDLKRPSTHPNVLKNAKGIVDTNIPGFEENLGKAKSAIEEFAAIIVEVEKKFEDEQLAAGGKPEPLVQTPLIEAIRSGTIWDR
jgi:hypothetical protein